MCSPYVSESVSEVPHSFIMSPKCDEQQSRGRKKSEGKGDMNERSRMSLYGFSVVAITSIVFISFAYFRVALLLYVWPPLNQVGDSRQACGRVGGGLLRLQICTHLRSNINSSFLVH